MGEGKDREQGEDVSKVKYYYCKGCCKVKLVCCCRKKAKGMAGMPGKRFDWWRLIEQRGGMQNSVNVRIKNITITTGMMI